MVDRVLGLVKGRLRVNYLDRGSFDGSSFDEGSSDSVSVGRRSFNLRFGDSG